MKSLGARGVVAGTVQVDLNADHTRLIGYCPTCGSGLSLELKSDGTHGSLVACQRCREIYRVETPDHSHASAERPCGFAVSFGVQGCWDPSAIMEYLFDNIGTVNPVRGGFACHPDEEHTDFPTIIVNQGARTVRFGLFGRYQEREAGAIINQAVSDFGAAFQVDLHPLWLERWGYGDDGQGFTLVERRPLGALLHEGRRRQARS